MDHDDAAFGPEDLAQWLASAAQQPGAEGGVVMGGTLEDLLEAGDGPGSEPNSLTLTRDLSTPVAGPAPLLDGDAIDVTFEQFAYADDPDHGEYLEAATFTLDAVVRGSWRQGPAPGMGGLMQAVMAGGGPPPGAETAPYTLTITLWPQPPQQTAASTNRTGTRTGMDTTSSDPEMQYDLLAGYRDRLLDGLEAADVLTEGTSSSGAEAAGAAGPGASPFDFDPTVDPAEFRVDVAVLGWADIALPANTLQEVRELVLGPLQDPAAYRTAGLSPPTGVLLEGEPGVGKTLLARVIASETDAAFYQVTPSQFKNQLFGASETIVTKLFAMAEDTNGPAILFLDEVDTALQQRGGTQQQSVTRDIVNQFLQEMDGLDPLTSTLVLGATNRVADIDDAARRPGRFDEELSLPLPDQATRAEIVQIELRQRRADGARYADDVDPARLAAQTEGATGADIAELVRTAGKVAVRERGPEVTAVTHADFDEALADLEAGTDDAPGFQ